MFRRPSSAPPPAERGQAAVEFVLLFPLIIGIILAVIEFGFIMFAFTTVNGAAREAARFATVGNVVGDCDVGIIGRAIGVGVGNVDCPDVAVVFVDRTSPPDGVAGRGDGVVVRVTHVYVMITPIGPLFEASSFGAISPTINDLPPVFVPLPKLEPGQVRAVPA